MPLYMDFHKFPRITLEEAKKAHLADESIQKKYGVKYLQFWVNEQAGTIFCLVEGPDKGTCESVHQMSHGHIACAMVEVDPSYYSLIMGENHRIDQGVVRDEEGAVDLGYRSILVANIQGKSAGRPKSAVNAKNLVKAQALVTHLIAKFNGRPLKLTGQDSLVSVFNSAEQAVNCSKAIQDRLLAQNKNAKGSDSQLLFNIGVSAGQPVTENNEFIEETIRLARRLCQAAGDGRILVSSLVHDLCTASSLEGSSKKIRSLSALDESFLTQLFDVLEANLSEENFTIEFLVQSLGVSRPQLYRKIHGLTGQAPNELIRDLRLNKAQSLLKRKSGNVSEIAFEVGFSNPSYFAKCFSRKFGYLPSEFLSEIV